MKKYLSIFIAFTFLIFVSACEKTEDIVPTVQNSNNTLKKGNPKAVSTSETAYSDAGTGMFVGFSDGESYVMDDACVDYGVYEFTLYAGKTNDAGTVTITNDESYLYVTYDTNGSADLGEAHVYVWTDESQIPDKRPAPGQAPYAAENINADSYTFMIPLSDLGLSDLCGTQLFISTHAALIGDGTDGDDNDDGSGDSNDGETAYAGGSNTTDGFSGDKGAWWGYVTYSLECFYDISGTVYDDSNNSSNLDSGEAGFEGISVSLFDENGNLISSVLTDADGLYLFEHIAGSADYLVTVIEGPEGYSATENANGFSVINLGECLNDIDFGFYMEEEEPEEPEEPENPTGEGTGALSYVSFATGCADEITIFSSGGDFTYNVETNYKQGSGNIKFEAEGDQLGEDGESETDVFMFEACDVSEIEVETKNKDLGTHTFVLGESHDMGNGFVVTWISKTSSESSFTYTFSVTSDAIGGGGN